MVSFRKECGHGESNAGSNTLAGNGQESESLGASFDSEQYSSSDELEPVSGFEPSAGATSYADRDEQSLLVPAANR